MKPQGVVGVMLLIAAAFILYFGGFSFTHREQVAKVGPVEVNADKTEGVAIPAILGWVCLAGGVVLVATGFRR